MTPLVAQTQTLCQQIGGLTYTPLVIDPLVTIIRTSTLPKKMYSSENILIRAGQTLLVDSEFRLIYCRFSMGPGARIWIDPACPSFVSAGCKYFGCGMWSGIKITSGNNASKITFAQNHIEDAYDAIEIDNQFAQVSAVRNLFNRNVIGITALGNSINLMATTNTFDCTSPLSDPNFMRSQAGVELGFCPSATVGANSTSAFGRNVFRNQDVGIAVGISTVNIGLSTFENCGIGIQAGGSSVFVTGGLQKGTSGAYAPNIFDHNLNDIVANSSKLHVTKSRFTNCTNSNITFRGVINNEGLFVANCHFTVSGTAGSKHAILLDRTSGGGSPIFTEGNSIGLDTIIIQPFGASVRGAIQVMGFPNSSGHLRIYDNLINVFSGGAKGHITGFIELNQSGSIRNEIGPGNHINSYNNTDNVNTNNNRWAILAHNGFEGGTGNMIFKNTIMGNDGTGHVDRGTCSIHLENTHEFLICDNTTTHTYRGLHFRGNCGRSDVIINKIGNHDAASVTVDEYSTGILLEPFGLPAYIGPQDCAGNDFTTNNYPNGWVAYYKGGYNKDNEFKANESDPQSLPTPRHPLKWFQFDANCTNQSDPVCVELAPPGGDIDHQDTTLARGYPTWVAGTDPFIWDAKKQLLNKISRYPVMTAQSQDIANFYDIHRYTSPDLFARFDSLIHLAYGIPAALLDTNKALTGLMNSTRNTLDSLDSTIPDTLTQVDYMPAAFLAFRQSLTDQMANLTNRWLAMRSQTQLYRTPILNYCEAYNQSLPSNALYESNQKFMNSLLIKHGRGDTLTKDDYTMLRSIANQCPEVAGLTRNRAIGWLPANESPYYHSESSEDPEGCGQNKSSVDTKEATEGQIRLMPTPANDLVRVFFPRPYSGILSVTDISGRQVLALSGIAQQEFVDLQTTSLAPGLYFVATVGHPIVKLLVAH